MPAGQPNSLRLFRLFGVDVYLHWTWFLVAVYQIYSQLNRYHSPGWKIAEYLALFLMVLLHEFGHALACRQVGGKADRIMLWPLGGVAYVAPPERPGAWLWSIAAGPLVNVAILIVTLAGTAALASLHLLPHGSLGAHTPDWYRFFLTTSVINVLLLAFNILPIYPLDGGQILRALLWFLMGRARSLFVVAVAGFAGVALLAAYAVYARSFWMGVITLFAFLRCHMALKRARRLTMIDQLPRRTDFSCNSCKAAPPIGEIWRCGQCKTPFDPFETQGVCPKCQTTDDSVQCIACKTVHTLTEWHPSPPPLAPVETLPAA